MCSGTGCQHCALTADLDGRPVTARVRIANLRQVAWSNERNAFLHKCDECGTLWESFAYEPQPQAIAAADAAKWYPVVS